jgi:hypothetical protein
MTRRKVQRRVKGEQWINDRRCCDLRAPPEQLNDESSMMLMSRVPYVFLSRRFEIFKGFRQLRAGAADRVVHDVALEKPVAAVARLASFGRRRCL